MVSGSRVYCDSSKSSDIVASMASVGRRYLAKSGGLEAKLSHCVLVDIITTKMVVFIAYGTKSVNAPSF